MLAPQELKPIKGYLGIRDVESSVADIETTEDRLWYVLLTEPQHERSAAAHLTGRRFKTFFPTVPCLTTRGIKRSKVMVHRPMMPGYLFIRLNFTTDGDRLHHIGATPGVHRFLKLSTEYAVVPDHELRRAQCVAEELAKPKPIQSMWFVGETVRITEGPFRGINATITDLYSGNRIRLEIEFRSAVVPATLDAAEIDKL